MSTSFNQKYKAQEVQEPKIFLKKSKTKKIKTYEKRKDDGTVGNKKENNDNIRKDQKQRIST